MQISLSMAPNRSCQKPIGSYASGVVQICFKGSSKFATRPGVVYELEGAAHCEPPQHVEFCVCITLHNSGLTGTLQTAADAAGIARQQKCDSRGTEGVSTQLQVLLAASSTPDASWCAIVILHNSEHRCCPWPEQVTRATGSFSIR